MYNINAHHMLPFLAVCKCKLGVTSVLLYEDDTVMSATETDFRYARVLDGYNTFKTAKKRH